MAKDRGDSVIAIREEKGFGARDLAETVTTGSVILLPLLGLFAAVIDGLVSPEIPIISVIVLGTISLALLGRAGMVPAKDAFLPAACAVLLAIWEILGLLWSPDKHAGWIEARMMLAASIFFLVGTRLDKEMKRRIPGALALALLVAVGTALYQRLFILPELFPALPALTGEAAARVRSGRVGGPFPLPSELSAFSAVALTASAAGMAEGKGRPRPLFLSALLAGLLGLILAGSLSGVVAACAGVGTILIRRSGARRRVLFITIVILAVAGAFVLLTRGGEIMHLSAEHNPFRLRYLTWLGALRTSTAAPLAGWGPGAFASAYPVFMLPNGDLVMYPHNFILSLSVETGLLGLLLLGMAFSPVRRGGRSPLLPLAVALAAALLLDIGFHDPGLRALLFLLAGAMTAAAAKEDGRRRHYLLLLLLPPLILPAYAEELWEGGGLREKRIALSLMPWDHEKIILLGEFASAIQRPAAALPFIEEAIRLAPMNARYRMRRASILRLTGRFEEASAEAERALNLAPYDPFISAEVETFDLPEGQGRDAVAAPPSTGFRRAPPESPPR